MIIDRIAQTLQGEKYKTNPENSYYVYVHYSELDGKPFYVGKGSRYRAWQETSRNQYWNSKHAKHGCRADIVFDGLTEADSFRVEIDTILELEYFGYRLCNLTAGGEGVSGLKQSAETIRKRVAKNTGKIRTAEQRKRLSDGNKGKTHSLETRQKLSAINKGRKRSIETVEKTAEKNRGKRRSEDTKKLMSEKAIQMALDKKLSERMSGNSNVSADKTIYAFVHAATGEIFNGTRCDICEKYDLNPNSLRNLFTNKRKVALGWSLLKEENDTTN